MTTLFTNQTSSVCFEAPRQTSFGVASKERLASAVAQVLAKAKTRYAQMIDRQAFDSLLSLDDHMLKDIGVTRQDVKWASNLPRSEDAGTQLEIIARRR